MPLIRRIIASPFTLRCLHGVHYALESMRQIEHVLVRVETDDGVVGLGEAPSRPLFYGETQTSIVAALTQIIAPRVLGLDLSRLDEMRSQLARIPANQAAKSAFEHAVFDAVGKTHGMSYRQIFGGSVEPVIAEWVLGLGSVEQTVESAIAARDRHGAFAFKLKVGANWRHEVRVIHGLRNALGSGIILFLDPNLALAPHEALQLAEATREAGVAYFEEPCSIEAVEIRRRIQEILPVAADESAPTTQMALQSILSGVSNMLNIKPARFGVQGSRWLLQLLELKGMSAMAGTQLETSVGSAACVALAASSPLTRARPTEAGLFLNLEGDIVERPLAVKNGRIVPPDGPGFGMTLDEDALKAHAGPAAEVAVAMQAG